MREPMLILPGSRFASATSAFTLRTGIEACTDRGALTPASCVMGAKSAPIANGAARNRARCRACRA